MDTSFVATRAHVHIGTEGIQVYTYRHIQRHTSTGRPGRKKKKYRSQALTAGHCIYVYIWVYAFVSRHIREHVLRAFRIHFFSDFL